MRPMTPRQSRIVQALLIAPGWITREAIDRIAGVSNGPDVISQLRKRLGHDAIETQLVEGIDRDGQACKTGRYRLTAEGRAKLAELVGDLMRNPDHTSATHYVQELEQQDRKAKAERRDKATRYVLHCEKQGRKAKAKRRDEATEYIHHREALDRKAAERQPPAGQADLFGG